MSEKEIIGRQFGDFKITEALGKGGMGSVYKSTQLSLHRPVAIKILSPSFANNKEFVERFDLEAKSVASLVHQNIIQMHSKGVTEEGLHYFAMEFVDGEDLAVKIKRGVEFSEEEIVDIIRQSCMGLESAWKKRIIHRDIKPSNIVITKEGVVKIADFGLAKSLESTNKLTRTDVFMGTVNYTAPEQGEGEQIDHRADIYSLGIVFYHLLTKRVPFKATSPSAVIYQHIHKRPTPPREVNPKISPEIEKVVLKAIAKKPEDRYQNMVEFRKALEAVKQKQPLPGKKEKIWEGKRNRIIALAGIILPLIIGSSTWYFLSHKAKDETAKIVPAPEMQKDETIKIVPVPEIQKDETSEIVQAPEMQKDEGKLKYDEIMENIYEASNYADKSVFASDLPPETVNLSSIVVLDEFPKENKHYKIDGIVRTDVPYYRFLIKSPHGDYDVLSIRDLFKVCHEIRVIENYRATEEGSEAWNAAGKSFKNIGRGAMQIIKEPTESVRAFGRAGKKLWRGIGRFLDNDEKKASDGTDRARGGKGMFVGKHARQFAAEQGLDVYTDNLYAKALIREVARKRAKGSVGVSAGLIFFSPITSVQLLSYSLTPSGIDPETEKLIRDESPPELKLILVNRYKELGPIYGKRYILKTFLNNPNYTPREKAYIYFYLKRLVKLDDDSPGVEDPVPAIDYLGNAGSPDEATFGTNQIELLSSYQQHAKDLKTLVITSNMLGAITEKKKLLFIIPYDIVGNTTDMKEFLDEVVADAKEHGAKKTQLWFMGNVTKGFIKKSSSKGITVKDNVLKYPHFAPKDTSDKSE